MCSAKVNRVLWAIRKARGRWSYADAFLPIVLLNLGQADAFSWAQTFMVSRVAVAWVVGMGRYAWGNTIFDSRYAAASVVALLAAGNPVSVRLFGGNPVSVRLFGQE